MMGDKEETEICLCALRATSPLRVSREEAQLKVVIDLPSERKSQSMTLALTWMRVLLMIKKISSHLAALIQIERPRK